MTPFPVTPGSGAAVDTDPILRRRGGVAAAGTLFADLLDHVTVASEATDAGTTGVSAVEAGRTIWTDGTPAPAGKSLAGVDVSGIDPSAAARAETWPPTMFLWAPGFEGPDQPDDIEAVPAAQASPSEAAPALEASAPEAGAVMLPVIVADTPTGAEDSPSSARAGTAATSDVTPDRGGTSDVDRPDRPRPASDTHAMGLRETPRASAPAEAATAPVQRRAGEREATGTIEESPRAAADGPATGRGEAAAQSAAGNVPDGTPTSRVARAMATGVPPSARPAVMASGDAPPETTPTSVPHSAAPVGPVIEASASRDVNLPDEVKNWATGPDAPTEGTPGRGPSSSSGGGEPTRGGAPDVPVVVPTSAPRQTDVAATVSAAEPAARQDMATTVVDQVVKSLRMQWKNGIGEARIQLRPEHLGPVDISISVEGGAITAVVRAESVQVQEWILNHQQSLRQQLEASGLRLDDLVVSPDAERQRQRGHEDPEARRGLARRRRAGDSEPIFNVVA